MREVWAKHANALAWWLCRLWTWHDWQYSKGGNVRWCAECFKSQKRLAGEWVDV